MKKYNQIILVVGAFIALVSCFSKDSKTIPNLPAGSYRLDKSHASLIFKVSHLGFSNYTARFKRFDADLEFDPKNPKAAKVFAIIDPSSLETDFPEPKKLNFNAKLQGKDWLNIAQFPKIIFKSEKIELTGNNSARIIGNLEMHGIKQPVILNATFNGGYAEHPMDPGGARIGFSAHGSLKRSDFGIKYGIPEAGSQMGVSDEVQFVIEAEFSKPTN